VHTEDDDDEDVDVVRKTDAPGMLGSIEIKLNSKKSFDKEKKMKEIAD